MLNSNFLSLCRPLPLPLLRRLPQVEEGQDSLVSSGITNAVVHQAHLVDAHHVKAPGAGGGLQKEVVLWYFIFF